jgi:integrase
MAKRRFQSPRPVKHGNWWTMVVRMDVLENGKLKRVRERVRLLPAERGEREARKSAAEYVRSLNQGMRGAGSALVYKTFIDTVYLPIQKTQLAKTSYERTNGVLEHYLLPVFGHLCLSDLSTLTIQTYLVGLDSKLSHESRDKIRDVLSASLRFAVEHGLMPSNPAVNLRVARDKRNGKPKPKKYVLSPEQFTELLKLIPEPYASMLYVSMFTGLRVSELIGLRWDDVHEESCSLTVDERYCRGDWDQPKSEASCATIPVNRSVIDRILRLKSLTVTFRNGTGTRRLPAVKESGPDKLVFQSVKDGKPMRDNNVLTRFIKPAARQLNMPWVNWLVLRRSHDNWLRLAGADLKDRQAQMRHAHPKVTADVYDQFMPENQRRAVDKLTQLTPLAPNDTKMADSEIAKLLKTMVARDGVEPPTPAFSGLRSTT